MTAACDANVGVNQQFKIKFVECDPAKTNACDTSKIQKMSGSPGYIDNYPLKVAFKQPSLSGQPWDGTYTSYVDGFEILGAGRAKEARGECLNAVAGNVNFDDPVIRFKQDLTYGCSQSLTESELAAYCNSANTK